MAPRQSRSWTATARRSTQTSDIAASELAATDVVISSETYTDFDDFDRPQSTWHLDGTHTESVYGCCGLSSFKDRDGTLTAYTYDTMKRQTSSTRFGITISNVFDLAGNVVTSLRIAGGSTTTILRAGYDDAGRLIAKTNALGQVTYHGQDFNETGQLVKTTTFPDTGTHIETDYQDSSVGKTHRHSRPSRPL